jgi:hypothetical protein
MRFLLGSMGAIALVCAVAYAGSNSMTQDEAVRAKFNADGSINLPVGYRQWAHIGTRLKPIGVSILDHQPTKTAEIFNAFVEPKAFAAFEATGKWPDGTQIVKEFSQVKVGEGCDEKTYRCTTDLGEGIFETGYIGLGMMVKDKERFPKEPGNWGFFKFGHHAPPYEPTAQVLDQSQCMYCHINLAAKSDYVISRAHIGLAK